MLRLALSMNSHKPLKAMLKDRDKIFRKVSFSKSQKSTTVHYEEPSTVEDDNDKVKRTIPSLPHADLKIALSRLSQHFLDVLEYDVSEWTGRWEIIGVKIKYKEGLSYIMVTARRELDIGEVVSQNSPYVPPNQEAKEALEEVFDEAEMALDGKRAGASSDLFEVDGSAEVSAAEETETGEQPVPNSGSQAPVNP